jgi:hypothetical protein
VEHSEVRDGGDTLPTGSQAHVEPDITMEIFFIDAPLGRFGAVEVTEPE